MADLLSPTSLDDGRFAPRRVDANSFWKKAILEPKIDPERGTPFRPVSTVIKNSKDPPIKKCDFPHFLHFLLGGRGGEGGVFYYSSRLPCCHEWAEKCTCHLNPCAQTHHFALVCILKTWLFLCSRTHHTPLRRARPIDVTPFRRCYTFPDRQ